MLMIWLIPKKLRSFFFVKKKKKKAENKFILTNFVKGYEVLDFAKLHI